MGTGRTYQGEEPSDRAVPSEASDRGAASRASDHGVASRASSHGASASSQDEGKDMDKAHILVEASLHRTGALAFHPALYVADSQDIVVADATNDDDAASVADVREEAYPLVHS